MLTGVSLSTSRGEERRGEEKREVSRPKDDALESAGRTM